MLYQVDRDITQEFSKKREWPIKGLCPGSWGYRGFHQPREYRGIIRSILIQGQRRASHRANTNNV